MYLRTFFEYLSGSFCSSSFGTYTGSCVAIARVLSEQFGSPETILLLMDVNTAS